MTRASQERETKFVRSPCHSEADTVDSLGRSLLTLILLTATAVLAPMIGSGCAGENGVQTKKGEKKVMTFSTHPGKIKMVDLSTGKSWEVPADEVPERQRFVYLKDGVETSDPTEATERVPIVEVQMLPLDANGNLVQKDKAVTIRIKEIGPDQRPLRSTTMVRH